MGRLEKRVYQAGLKGALTGIYEDAIEASEILKETFDSNFRSAFLRVLVKNDLFSIFLRYSLTGMFFIRKCIRKASIPIYWGFRYPGIKDYLR